MDQKEIEEKLKNFQVKHIEKPEKKEEQPLSDHEGFCEQWKHAAKILIGIGGEWKKSKREDICETYDLLAKCLEGRRLFYRNYQHRRGNFPVPVRCQPDHSALRQ